MFVLVVLCFAISLLLYRATRRPSGFPPGPFSLPVVGHLPFLRSNVQDKFVKFGKRYGDVFSINLGPFFRLVVLNSYSAVKDAYKEEAFSGRPNEMYFFHYRAGGNHGIAFSEGSNWHEVRPALLRELRDFGFGKSVLETAIVTEVAELLKILKKENGKPIEPHGRFSLSAVNALWAMVTGDRMQLDDPQLNHVSKTVRKSITNLTITDFPIILPFWNYLPGKLIGMEVVEEYIGAMKSIFQNKINLLNETYKKDGQTDNIIKTILDKMSKTTDSSSAFYGDKGMNNLLYVMMDLFIAGSETVSSTLIWLVLLMAKHPHIQDLVHEETDRVNELYLISRLPFFEAVILETLRFGTIAPSAILHKVIFNTEFRGFKLPKGTVVLSNLFAVHRDPSLWEKPYEFYPQHFLDEKGNLKKVDYLIPFSTGKRVCIGESLAKMELFLFGSHLVHTFKFAFPENTPEPSFAATKSVLRIPLPYKVCMTPRF